LRRRKPAVAADNNQRFSAEAVESQILTFLRTELLSPDVSIDRDDELLSGEILDSIGMVRLAAFVQERFLFKMVPSDFVIANFRSVAALATYVRRATGPGP
jgi:acyl carrier protein